MIFGEIDASLKNISVHSSSVAFELAGDNLHPIAPAESVVKTHALEGIGLVGVGARNDCQFVHQRFNVSWGLVERIGTLQA